MSNKCLYFLWWKPGQWQEKNNSPHTGQDRSHLCMGTSYRQSMRTVLQVTLVAKRHLPPHSSVPAHFLHSSGPFPLWGPRHRCHRSCHYNLGQWGTRKPSSHCIATPAAGLAPPRSASSLEEAEEFWVGQRNDIEATVDEPARTVILQDGFSHKNTQEYQPPQGSSTLALKCSGANQIIIPRRVIAAKTKHLLGTRCYAGSFKYIVSFNSPIFMNQELLLS